MYAHMWVRVHYTHVCACSRMYGTYTQHTQINMFELETLPVYMALGLLPLLSSSLRLDIQGMVASPVQSNLQCEVLKQHLL